MLSKVYTILIGYKDDKTGQYTKWSISFMYTYVIYKLAGQKVQLKDLIDYVWLSAS